MKLGYIALLPLSIMACSSTEERPMSVVEEPEVRTVVKEEPTTQSEQAAPTIKQNEQDTAAFIKKEEKTTTPDSKTYTVQRGDSLWKISGKPQVYSNPFLWPVIYKANRNVIKDADLIYPKQVFNIPATFDADSAIKHAKTRGAWSISSIEKSDIAYLNK